MRTAPCNDWEAVYDSKLSDSLRLYDMQPGTQQYEIPTFELPILRVTLEENGHM